MKEYFPRRRLKEEGKRALSGHWGKAIVITLIGFIPNMIAFNSQMNNFNVNALNPRIDYRVSTIDETSMQLIFVLGIVITLIIASYIMASSKWYLDLVQKKNPSMGDFFGNFNLIGKGILAYLWTVLWLAIWTILPLILMTVSITLGGLHYLVSNSSGESFIFLLLFILSMIAYIVISIWKSYSYKQIYNVIADNPEIGVRKSMRYSILMSKEYIVDLLILDLSFILWVLLILVTMGLGIFYVQPYVNSTYARTYFFLRNQALDKGILSPDVFGVIKREEEREGEYEN